MDQQTAMASSKVVVNESSAKEINAAIANAANGATFTEDGTPKLFAGLSALPGSLVADQGNTQLKAKTVVIGSSEAKMMQDEGLFKNVGDVLPDFFGIKNVTVGGILKSTGTLADSYHFLAPEVYSLLDAPAQLQVVAEDNGSTKQFFFIDGSVPEKLANAIGSTSPAKVGGKEYYPVYVGSSEAAMMKEKKLFVNDGDTIQGFFGNNAIVYTLPKTDTVLDTMHFVDESFSVSIE
jgi:hypothetical protein